jgi:branched-chain amino acid transport system substrate-binding protein
MRLPGLLIALATVPFLSPTATHAQEPIKIGVVQVLSGSMAKYGISAYQGIQLAADQINEAGGINGRPLKLFVEDSAGTKDMAVNAVRKLIGREKVDVILGPTSSTESLAATPIANQRKVPSLALTATAKGIAAIGEYVFRTAQPESNLIPASISRAKARYGLTRAAVPDYRDSARLQAQAPVLGSRAPDEREISAREKAENAVLDVNPRRVHKSGRCLDPLRSL